MNDKMGRLGWAGALMALCLSGAALAAKPQVTLNEEGKNPLCVDGQTIICKCPGTAGFNGISTCDYCGTQAGSECRKGNSQGLVSPGGTQRAPHLERNSDVIRPD